MMIMWRSLLLLDIILDIGNDIVILKCYAFPLAIGFNVETVVYKNLKFQVWDLGGQTTIR